MIVKLRAEWRALLVEVGDGTPNTEQWEKAQKLMGEALMEFDYDRNRPLRWDPVDFTKTGMAVSGCPVCKSTGIMGYVCGRSDCPNTVRGVINQSSAVSS